MLLNKIMKQIFINEKEAATIKEAMAVIEEDSKDSHPIRFTSDYKNLQLKINKFLKLDDIK